MKQLNCLRCILIALGLEMLFISLLLSYAAAYPHGDTDGTPMPFYWDRFGKNILIASPVIAIAVGLIVYNFKSLMIENAIEEKGRRLKLRLIQTALVISFFIIPWIIIGFSLKIFQK